MFPKLQALLVIQGGVFTKSENFVTSFACNLENLTPNLTLKEQGLQALLVNPVSFITNSVCNLGKPNTFGVLERVRLTTYGCLPEVSGFLSYKQSL